MQEIIQVESDRMELDKLTIPVFERTVAELDKLTEVARMETAKCVCGRCLRCLNAISESRKKHS